MKSTLVNPAALKPLTFPCLLQWVEGNHREIVLAVNEYEGVVILSQGSGACGLGHFHKKCDGSKKWSQMPDTWELVPYPITVEFTP